MVTPDRQFSEQRLADLYDLGNAGSEDRDFYLRLAGPPPQSVLDLGCGTGLLCHAFAARGHSVTGVDPAEAMLSVARRGAGSDQIEWVQSDAEAFSSDKRFDLIIMTGHAFQVLLTDAQIRATFQTFARHLKPDGRVVFESRIPNLDWDAIWARDYTVQSADGPVRAVRRMTDVSRAPHFLSFAWDYHFTDEIITSDSTLRFLTLEQVQAFAADAGLSLIKLSGEWDGSDFERDTSREMIFQFKLADVR